MMVSTPSPLSSVTILRDGYTVAAGGVDGEWLHATDTLICLVLGVSMLTEL